MPTFSFLISHQGIVCIAWQDDWGWGDSNIYHQSFKAKNKTYPTTPTVAPWLSAAHAGVGNKGEQVKAEFSKVFKPMLSSGNCRFSQFHQPCPEPQARGGFEFRSSPNTSRVILAGTTCAVGALQIRTSSIYIALYQKLMTQNYIKCF